MGLNRPALVYPNSYYHNVMDWRLFELTAIFFHKRATSSRLRTVQSRFTTVAPYQR